MDETTNQPQDPAATNDTLDPAQATPAGESAEPSFNLEANQAQSAEQLPEQIADTTAPEVAPEETYDANTMDSTEGTMPELVPDAQSGDKKKKLFIIGGIVVGVVVIGLVLYFGRGALLKGMATIEQIPPQCESIAKAGDKKELDACIATYGKPSEVKTSTTSAPIDGANITDKTNAAGSAIDFIAKGEPLIQFGSNKDDDSNKADADQDAVTDAVNEALSNANTDGGSTNAESTPDNPFGIVVDQDAIAAAVNEAMGNTNPEGTSTSTSTTPTTDNPFGIVVDQDAIAAAVNEAMGNNTNSGGGSTNAESTTDNPFGIVVDQDAIAAAVNEAMGNNTNSGGGSINLDPSALTIPSGGTTGSGLNFDPAAVGAAVAAGAGPGSSTPSITTGTTTPSNNEGSSSATPSIALGGINLGNIIPAASNSGGGSINLDPSILRRPAGGTPSSGGGLNFDPAAVGAAVAAGAGPGSSTPSFTAAGANNTGPAVDDAANDAANQQIQALLGQINALNGRIGQMEAERAAGANNAGEINALIDEIYGLAGVLETIPGAPPVNVTVTNSNVNTNNNSNTNVSEGGTTATTPVERGVALACPSGFIFDAVLGGCVPKGSSPSSATTTAVSGGTSGAVSTGASRTIAATTGGNTVPSGLSGDSTPTSAPNSVPSNTSSTVSGQSSNSGSTSTLHGAFIQGETGPGILAYPAILGASNILLYMRRRKKKTKQI
jgi:trimeric autotransporter adhesin